MDAMTRSRLLSLATVRLCAKPGVTGVTGVTGPANPAGSRLSHLPLHLEGAGKTQSNQRVTPVTPCNTLESAGAADLGPQRCNEPEAQGVTALVTPVSPAVDAEDWQAVYNERAAVREFDGGLPRGQAERLAHADTVTELREPPPGVQMTAPLATGVSTFPTSAGSELDLKTARRRGLWWDGPAWDEPEFHVGVMAEWQLGLQRLSPHREPCPGFRSGQWLGVYEVAQRFLAEHGPSAADLGWSTLDLFGVDPKVGVARVSCCGALLVSGGSPVVDVAAAAIRYRSGLVFRKAAVPDPSVPVWDFAWPEAGR
jgi:hypothetical protein